MEGYKQYKHNGFSYYFDEKEKEYVCVIQNPTPIPFCKRSKDAKEVEAWIDRIASECGGNVGAN